MNLDESLNEDIRLMSWVTATIAKSIHTQADGIGTVRKCVEGFRAQGYAVRRPVLAKQLRAAMAELNAVAETLASELDEPGAG